MGRPWSAFVLSFAWFLSAGLCLAAPDDRFDQGADHRPILKEAVASAGKPLPAASRARLAGDDVPVWISVANQDVAALGEAFSFPDRPVILQSGTASVYEARTGDLPELSEAMHRKFHKCGGFFAHRTLEAAQRDLEPASAAAAAAYTIDQGAIVPGMLSRAQEAAITETITKLSSFKNRYYRSQTGVASSRWIAQRWKELSQGRADMSVSLFRHEGWEQESVILTVAGTVEPQKVVVLGGHADSIAGWYGGSDAVAPGADDNASGVAALTEAVRIIVVSGYRPKRTLKFMAYAAEEVGLRGSRDIADAFKKDGVAVQGAFQLDMTNFNGSAEDIFLITDNTDAAQNDFLAKLAATYTPYKLGRTACGYACSDHASWSKNGFAASFPFEAKFGEDNQDIHSAQDTLAQSGGHSRHALKFAKLAVAYLVEMAK
ncbi:MAG: M20/M25/M40 family metallo-hydrolase [Elusimicrobia bacterium]|nr:M20/M25/M40 family metallo-hydrolase [Elusimicrobiota bacterium]